MEGCLMGRRKEGSTPSTAAAEGKVGGWARRCDSCEPPGATATRAERADQARRGGTSPRDPAPLSLKQAGKQASGGWAGKQAGEEATTPAAHPCPTHLAATNG